MLITATEEKQFYETLEKLKAAQDIVVDLETTGLHPYEGDRLIGIALYLPVTDESFYLSFRHSETANLPLDWLRKLYEPLSRAEKSYWGWNVKFDAHFLLVDGFPILTNGAIYRDVMIALHMLDENRYDLADKRGLNYRLKDNARLYLGTESARDDSELDDLLKSRGLGKGDLWKLRASDVSDYAESDVKLTWQLLKFFEPFLALWKQTELFDEKCRFNGGVLLRMEHTGIPVDREKIQSHIQQNVLLAAGKLEYLQSIYGQQFNPKSPTQVKNALGTKDAKRITLSREGTQEAQDVIDFQYISKANGTFYTPYLKKSLLDGRIHPSFNVTRTNSGRLSSSDPNLQQVPRYSEQYRVKEVFVPPKGYKLVQFDYSQQELRLACHFSGQENMTQEYVEKGKDADVHSLTTSVLFKISYEDAKLKENKPKRNIGKVTNFGFSYGMGIMKAAVYIASSLNRTLYIDEKFYIDHVNYLPKITKTIDSKPIHSTTETRMVVEQDEWGGNQIIRQVPVIIGYEKADRQMTYEEFKQRFEKYYAGAILVDDAIEAENSDPKSISIWTTTKILRDWKALYSKFVDSLKENAMLANEVRDPEGNYTGDIKTGFRYMRLADNFIRHYIKGQRPFTAWNLLIQGTGAIIMRRALMRVHETFPVTQDEVIPAVSVHDSMIAMIKENAQFDRNVREIKRLMEDFPEYYPNMLVDVEYGDNWGILEDWE